MRVDIGKILSMLCDRKGIDILKANGEEPITRVLSDEEYW